MAAVIEGLDGPERVRIEALLGGGRFFWIDVSSREADRNDLRETLRIPDGAFGAVFAFGEREPVTASCLPATRCSCSRSRATSSRPARRTGRGTGCTRSRCTCSSVVNTC